MEKPELKTKVEKNKKRASREKIELRASLEKSRLKSELTRKVVITFMLMWIFCVFFLSSVFSLKILLWHKFYGFMYKQISRNWTKRRDRGGGVRCKGERDKSINLKREFLVEKVPREIKLKKLSCIYVAVIMMLHYASNHPSALLSQLFHST